MGLKNFLKNTKRVNVAGYLGSVKGSLTNDKWFGVNIEGNCLVFWSNSSDDIVCKQNDIIGFEKIEDLEYKITLKNKGDFTLKFVADVCVDRLSRFIETGV